MFIQHTIKKKADIILFGFSFSSGIAWSRMFLYEKFEEQFSTSRSSRLEVFWKKVLLKILVNLQENTSARVSFLIKL